MSKITYTDKVAINQNSDIPDINKVNASDMNEIKSVVNGLVVNAYSTSEENAYSCDYINGKVLWENVSGSSSNIVLNDSASNYSRIDIITAAPASTWDNYGVMITTIYPNISTKWILIDECFGGNWGSINHEIITINGTNLTRGTSYKFSASNGSINSTFSTDTANKAIIYKVIGYK